MHNSGKKGESGNLERGFGSEEKVILKIIEEIAEKLREKYGYTDEEIFSLLKKDEVLVPLEIFSSGLAPAEALTKFLKENCDKNFHEISLLINRNEKSVWQNYHRAIKKMPSHFVFDSSLKIPLSAFSDNRLSIFECLIFYLKKQKQMKNIKIARLLGKHPANVWSVYSRAVRKVANGKIGYN
jgi:DNA-directed RNA polymerase specialized sigma24 family protein